jgi:hypothetical protein
MFGIIQHTHTHIRGLRRHGNLVRNRAWHYLPLRLSPDNQSHAGRRQAPLVLRRHHQATSRPRRTWRALTRVRALETDDEEEEEEEPSFPRCISRICTSGLPRARIGTGKGRTYTTTYGKLLVMTEDWMRRRRMMSWRDSSPVTTRVHLSRSRLVDLRLLTRDDIRLRLMY